MLYKNALFELNIQLEGILIRIILSKILKHCRKF